eukprot:908993-Amphidinium_carterae.1
MKPHTLQLRCVFDTRDLEMNQELQNALSRTSLLQAIICPNGGTVFRCLAEVSIYKGEKCHQ